MKTTGISISISISTALSAAILASHAIASASAKELTGTAADVWHPAPEPVEPPFQCDQQPTSMIKSVPGSETMCITRGSGICRDNGILGEWKFGLDKDTGAVTVVDPDGVVMPMYGNNNWEGAEKLCIQNIPKKALYKPWHKKNRNLRAGNDKAEAEAAENNRELAQYEDDEVTEPYMAIYGAGGKRMAELICHDVGNQGVATQLKMTDLRGYNLAKEGFPFTVTKVKRGQLGDNDDNALWGISIEHTYEIESLQKVTPVLKAKIAYDDTYCTWQDYTQTEAPTGAPTVSAAPSVKPDLRGFGETCSKFKKCEAYKDGDKQCKDKATNTMVPCPENPAEAMYCDYYADEPGAEDDKNSKNNKSSKDGQTEIVTDAEYYSPFNLFGKCTTCIASSTDLMEASSCKGQDDECCDNAEYGPSMCGELVHGGRKVCRPACRITEEVCKSNSECCDAMCYIDRSKGPGKALASASACPSIKL
eukprot:CAMPEP_0181062904 /NCGR_PEP_ID=MMETSP1070-20121207/23333_1 /TAXON_ID=265543 /ORGANISM="Minutocellus polymorphus, Strain NH13" /LENGTH=476 /DNA_ID=CAMNT_0023143017 /DNA_START=38 /DNA_END=1466 /DNA_ORIENTATION=+